MALFKRPQVPKTMTAETTGLTAGSSHSQLMSQITIPAAATPAVTSASAAKWKKALFTLKSPAPEENSSAVPPLTKMPMAATATMTPLATCTGWLMLQIAPPGDPAGYHQQNDRVRERRENGAAAQPVGEPATRLPTAQHRGPQDKARPSTSPRVWPASASRASEPEKTPATASPPR